MWLSNSDRRIFMCYIHISPEMKIQSEYFWCPWCRYNFKGCRWMPGRAPSSQYLCWTGIKCQKQISSSSFFPFCLRRRVKKWKTSCNCATKGPLCIGDGCVQKRCCVKLLALPVVSTAICNQGAVSFWNDLERINNESITGIMKAFKCSPGKRMCLTF